MAPPAVLEPPMAGDQARVHVIMNHGHQDLVQAVAFNSYGDRCATGSVDGKIRVFNRHQDGTWRQCDNWTAHGGDILELQWLPPSIFPNLVASLGIEGRFKLWAEDPAAAPGKRFSQRNKENAKAAYEHKSRGGAPYRSFSLRHNDETRHTHLALLAADGVLDVLENEQPENLADFNPVDRLAVCNPRPARGEETSFRVRFDPNPDPCYSALRAGVQTDSLALVVAAMRTVRIYRSRDAISSAAGPSAREFYLAAEISGHGGLVRDVAWAAGNIRGYDIIATACQDGFVRVVRLDTPFSPNDGKSWSSSDLVKSGSGKSGTGGHDASGGRSGTSRGSRNSLQQQPSQQQQQQQSQHPAGLPNPPPARSVLGSELAISSANVDRVMTGQPGEARHVVRELSRLESHRTPVWRVGFDDDGQILGSVGDDGKLMCYRQTPDGSWAKSSELAMVKMRMAVPQMEPGF